MTRPFPSSEARPAPIAFLSSVGVFPMTASASRAAMLVTVAFFAGAGCGPTGVSGPTVTGVVLKDGERFPMSPTDPPVIEFVVVQGGELTGLVFRADVNPKDGTFTVAGPTGTGIPPGEYRVFVRTTATEVVGTATPLAVTISSGPGPITLDLGRTPSVRQ